MLLYVIHLYISNVVAVRTYINKLKKTKATFSKTPAVPSTEEMELSWADLWGQLRGGRLTRKGRQKIECKIVMGSKWEENPVAEGLTAMTQMLPVFIFPFYLVENIIC